MASTSNPADEAVVLSKNWCHPIQVTCKRALDLVLSSVFLLLLSPLFLILAIAVKTASPGPVFYPWKVVGRNGLPFTGYKFRSMVVNADALKAELQAHNEMTGPMFKMTDDPRVTSVGKWMRRYSFDELPQLYSVLRGDMSLVGPRPPLATEYEQFSQFQKQKLAVKPGITCLWQVEGRNVVNDFDEWVGLDLQYIRSWSLALDLKILWNTVGAVLSGSGK